eukprot:SAG11_NODE_225_length_12064_cov_7.850815_8_plen_82_part_00
MTIGSEYLSVFGGVCSVSAIDCYAHMLRLVNLMVAVDVVLVAKHLQVQRHAYVDAMDNTAAESGRKPDKYAVAVGARPRGP